MSTRKTIVGSGLQRTINATILIILGNTGTLQGPLVLIMSGACLEAIHTALVLADTSLRWQSPTLLIAVIGSGTAMTSFFTMILTIRAITWLITSGWAHTCTFSFWVHNS